MGNADGQHCRQGFERITRIPSHLYLEGRNGVVCILETRMAWFDGLTPGTPAHKIASIVNPRVRVVAGPGTGKSYAMKRRVARLLESGVAPDLILPVTFTRVAAQDLHR